MNNYRDETYGEPITDMYDAWFQTVDEAVFSPVKATGCRIWVPTLALWN